jgi:MerR family transcriptional regulator, thiopeptide resistance regulator
LGRLYRAREFSQLAGITTKALRHYERLGLLQPGRTAAGYRQYTGRHLERLEQILALKFLGLPLKEIRGALERTPRALPEALHMQRRALQEKQARLRGAIRAIEAAERALETGELSGTAALQKIIEVIKVQDAIEAMKRYYGTDEEWEKRKRYYEEGPGPEWCALYRDAAALLGEDPANEKVQALADRWLALTVRAASGDPAVQQDSGKAWMDREHWPAAMKARIAEFRLEEVTELMRQAALCARKKYFSEQAWAVFVEMRKQSGRLSPPTWQARVDLFRAAESALGEDPAAAQQQRLGQQWMALFDVDSGGDASVKAGLMRCWADRPHWSAVVRWLEEGVHMMSGERFERVADFLDHAALESGCRA